MHANTSLTRMLSVSLMGAATAFLLTACDSTPSATAPSPSATSSLMAASSIEKPTQPPKPGKGQLPVNLGSAGAFAILSKSGITDVPSSSIVGDVGTSPITGAAILLTCAEVTGTVYSVDAAGPGAPCMVTSPSRLSTAVGDMEHAYNDAAGRVNPDFLNLGGGEIGGLTLASGLYKWGTGVTISTNVKLAGGPNDVWIFQVAGTLTQSNATRVTLSGGAQARNIFWQVADTVSMGTSAHFEGIVLAKTAITPKTSASVTGRLLAQTAVTLKQNAVTQPN